MGLEGSWNGSEALSSGVVVADGKSSEAERKVVSEIKEVADDIACSVSCALASFAVGFTLNGKAVRAGDGDAGTPSSVSCAVETAAVREVNQGDART